ncbi:MAG: ABC transporter permease [Ardenticatenaceae bacterium]|nr:ABC transporter permease [Ardenticatenaceae bacterium]MCB9444493.1 ABC transporter permease [Ardenticatenaceae bacterium]
MLFRIWNLIRKEFIQLFRDRLLAPFVLLGPLSELLMVAWSTSQGIYHLPTAVLDLDMSPASRAIVVAMENARTFDPYYVSSLDDITSDITTGHAMAAWVIPAGFQAHLLESGVDSAPMELIVDGADVVAAQTAVEVGEGVVASYGARLTTSPQSPAPSSPLDMSLRVWFNEEMKESNYMIPSELGFIAAAIAAMVASMMIARERELGTLEQLMVTPISSFELVVGKSVLAIALGYTEFLLMLGMVVWFFDVPMRGSLPLLMIVALIYMLVELGWGLMISAVARNQMQALLIAFAVIMVMVIFSGYAFPVETMPPFMQSIANIFPLKHWLTIFRGILLKGAGIDVFWRELLAILGLGVVIYTGTILLLRQKKLE